MGYKSGPGEATENVDIDDFAAGSVGSGAGKYLNLGTAAETIAAGDLCFLSSSTNTTGSTPQWWKTSARGTAATRQYCSASVLGMAKIARTAGQPAKMLVDGYMYMGSAKLANYNVSSSNTPGRALYMASGSAANANTGLYRTIPPTGSGNIVRLIGNIVTTTTGSAVGTGKIYVKFSPDNTWVIVS